MVRYTAGREHGEHVCERAGYEVTFDGSTTLATPTVETDGFFQDDRSVVVESLAPEAVTPDTLVPRYANALANGHAVLFVVPDAPAVEQATAVLDTPYCVAEETESRCRTFYNGPDRIPLSDGRYALARANEYVWKEVDPDDPELEGRTGSDRKDLLLEGDGELVTVFDSVDGLACPSPDAFPFTYGRTDDKQFHVYGRDGTEIGRFGSVRAMREQGYQPIPMPLVPEHVFERGPLSRSWAVCAEDSFTVHTADGTRAA
jgi:hypothetical protein